MMTKGILYGNPRAWTVLEPMHIGSKTIYVLHSRVASYAIAKALAKKLKGKVRPT